MGGESPPFFVPLPGTGDLQPTRLGWGIAAFSRGGFPLPGDGGQAPHSLFGRKKRTGRLSGPREKRRAVLGAGYGTTGRLALARLVLLDTDRGRTSLLTFGHLRRERGCGGGRGTKRTPPAPNTAAAPLGGVVAFASTVVLLVARALCCALRVRWVGEAQALRCGDGRRWGFYKNR